MRKLFLILVVLLVSIGLQKTNAQIPDNTNGRLYRLCKTWGYFKYFSQHKCELKWDTLLNTTINEVLLANSNADFNTALMHMFNKVGNNSYSPTPCPQPDTNMNVDNSWINDLYFSQPVKDFLNTFSLYIYPDTSTCFVKFNDQQTQGYSSYIDFRGDPLSMPVILANETNRLTVMFYYWNIINYFSPNRNVMDQPWDSTLFEFIPMIRQVTSVLDFHTTFLKLVTKINDAHGFTNSNYLTYYFWGGYYIPKIYFTRVDTICVVTRVEGITGVSPGDILTALKGIPIREIEDSLTQYVPASNPASLYRDIYKQMMLGENNTIFPLTLLDSNGNTYMANAKRIMTDYDWYFWHLNGGLDSSYFITTCGYGYVNMGMLMPDELTAMYELLKDAPAIIFDMRNSPNMDLTDLAQLLFPGPIISAIFYDQALTRLSGSDNLYYFPGWYYQRNDLDNMGIWSNPNAYNGKVYILVNEQTQSSAEYNCQYLSYHPGSRVFGTQTAGADGNISYLLLPDFISTCFTSLGWYYGDGYQEQRNGVKIDTVVSPTIAGIRHGRDEILEAALDCLTGIKDLNKTGNKLYVYPNPVTDYSLNIEVTLADKTDVDITLFNSSGNLISQESMHAEQGKNVLRINIPGVGQGLYLLKVQFGNEITTTKVMVE